MQNSQKSIRTFKLAKLVFAYFVICFVFVTNHGDTSPETIRRFTNTESKRTNVLSESKSPWTDWYKKSFVSAVLILSDMRQHLEKFNLFDPYRQRPEAVVCGPETLNTRTADGSCNDLSDSTMGATWTRIGHNIPLEASFPDESNLLEPNPRALSLEFMTRHEFKPVEVLNLLAVGWIQFMVHDWFNHGENEPLDPFYIPLSDTDPFQQKEMLVLKTRYDRSRTVTDYDLPPTYQNEVTHWWDGSQVYGSDSRTQKSLRTFNDGLLKIVGGRLGLDHQGIENVGMNRNWWVGLDLMHHLFVFEHNAISKHLKEKHPDWTDHRLFETARLVNAAVMAKIHSIEWTPAILSNRTLERAMNANWYGLLNPGPKVKQFYEIFKNPVLFGIVGGAKELNGVPYSMTEEFTSVYRMHNLLPESIWIRSHQTSEKIAEVPTGDTRNAGAALTIEHFGLVDLFYTFGKEHPGALTLNNYPRFLQNIDLPIAGKTDLAATDLLRDRERGMPRYNSFRRQMGLKELKSFDQLTDDASIVSKLRQFYKDDIEQLDLMIGCLAEGHRPYGYGFGETQFQVFIIMASRRLHADRFYTTQYNAKTYSKEGIKWIEKATMKSVIGRHFPELLPSMKGIDNAFRPWK